ncbi:hypothetical protein PGB34_14340 [Xenophilus arseniciresistens]|uniref:DUF11 domain-containing protein n=1 Tax=Xenophilus arseniciresistens TaxID=1283306 RepID=A0AAE3SZW6_9BURK|nr:hypothetical protein [Xenophilus arseniciresistens]MDA7417544.1 hypothetical protein [Xenophilus arseniciresistens]
MAGLALLSAQALAQTCAAPGPRVADATLTVSGGSCDASRPCTFLNNNDAAANPNDVLETNARIISSTAANPITFTFSSPHTVKTVRVNNAWGVRDIQPYQWSFQLLDASGAVLATTPAYTDPNPQTPSSVTSPSNDTNPPPTVDSCFATAVANVKTVRWIVTSYYATRIYPNQSGSTPSAATGNQLNYAETRDIDFFAAPSDPSIPTVQLAKRSTGATGTFGFAMTNLGSSTDSISTTSDGVAANSALTALVSNTAQPVTVTETVPANHALTGASCTDTNAATTGNPASFGTLAGAVLTIPAANLRPFAKIVCTFENRATRIRFQKTTLPAGQNQNFTVAAFNGLPATTINASSGASAYAVPTSLAAGNLTENAVAGWRGMGLSCAADTGFNGETTGAAVLTNTTPATAVNTAYTTAVPAGTFKAGNDYTCTFSNGAAVVRLAKSTSPVAGVNQSFSNNIASNGLPASGMSFNAATGPSTYVVITNPAAATSPREAGVLNWRGTGMVCRRDSDGVAVHTATNVGTTGAAYTPTAIPANTFVPGTSYTCTLSNERLLPVLTKAFSPSAIVQGGTATLTFTIQSLAGVPLQAGLTFTDTLPAGLVLAQAPALNQCGGLVTGAAGGSTILLAAGSLPAGPSSCQITVQVTSAPGQGAATCPSAATTNASGNISALPVNLVNGVTDQCLGISTTAPTITLQKALGGTGRISGGDQFSLSGTGTGAPAAVTTTGTGAAVSSAAYTITATPGTAYALTEAMAAGSSSLLTQYSQAVSCTNTGPTNVSSINSLPINVTPQVGDAVSCTVTNTPKPATLSLQKALGGSGRISASDQFTLSGSGTGAPAALTTTGSGTAITSAAYSFNATPGTSYSLNEAMAAGSASALVQYDKAVSCTNTGPTNVSGLSTLPINVTPVAGDAISCTITNTPATIIDPGPNGGDPAALTCNADPVISGTNFTAAEWVKSNWDAVSSGAVTMNEDSGTATLSQSVSGVTPGALLTFSWRFRNGIISTGSAGNASRLSLSYGGVTYWTVNTNDGTLNLNSDAATASNGASCVSGCGALAEATDRMVRLRLPTGIPISGLLRFTAQSFGGTSDDMTVRTAVSILNTGVCLAKTSAGGTGTFNFTTGTNVDTTMGGGGTTASITTAAVNTPVLYDASATRTNAQPLLIKSPGASANVTITETPAPGFVLNSVTCSDGLTPMLNGNTISIASVPRDTVASCIVTNSTSTINFSKALSGSRAVAGDQFTVAVRTGGVNGTVVNSTAASTTTGSGATVNAGTGTTGDVRTTPRTAYTLTEAGAAGAVLGNYSGRLTCTDAAGVMPASSLPTNEVFDPVAGRVIIPLSGANLRCVLTNTSTLGPSITLQKALGGAGRIAANDQFTLSATGTGAPAAVTTAGTGTAVTSPAYTFTATAGTAYTLNEAMAAGSTSALANYTQSVTCSNTGPTDVSALTTLPINVTPAASDAISCVITNTPAVPAVSGKVFLDNGTGGGTANDGILNGGEAPQAGIAVRLTNCAATVYASGVTDGTGSYSLSVPSGTAAGAALCVEQVNSPATRISTGASVGNTALPSGSATAAAGGSYTYTRTGTPDRIAFSWNGTGHANLNFGDVDNSSFATSGAKTALPGSTVTYPHTFTAGTGGQVRFGIASETATPALAGWAAEIFADPLCTGSLQPGAQQLYPPGTATTAVAFAGKVCVIVKQFVPANAPMGASNKLTIRADFDYLNANPALGASFTLEDITTVSSTALELRKEVRNVTQSAAFGVNNQAKSGETLEYRITYTNNGDAPISAMTVNDTTPGYTTFVSATQGTTPASLTACQKTTPANAPPAAPVACADAQPAGGTGPIGWKFTGTVAPGGTGFVLFQVKVD